MGERSTPNVARPNRPPLAETQTAPRNILSGPSWNWLALAAAIVFAAIMAFNFVPQMRRSDGNQSLATQLIASHVRSLMASHLTDVTSTDQHTVKPWLDTKLDFAPPVVDLSSEGFPLIGGRLDYLDNRPAAVLVYQRRKHFINLFVWPADPNAKKETSAISRQGYHLLNWADSDFNYWAVSDVNADDLQILKQQFQAKTSH
jgi:anti-sigma factor RsiW